MLVLSRKMNEVIVIGTDISIKVVEVRGNRVKLGITAPGEGAVRRAEICIDLPGDSFRGEKEAPYAGAFEVAAGL